MDYKFMPMEFISEVADMSSDFERENTELKKQYLIRNINKISSVMQSVEGCIGTFGTGYPFYALGQDYKGHLPIIQEQIRYNNVLKGEAVSSGMPVWVCADCLDKKGIFMKDLKVVCKSCPAIAEGLKPRKVINRLPDVDMWMVCEDDKVEEAKVALKAAFEAEEMYPSDIDPVKSMYEIKGIVEELKNGKMPEKYLPLDIHIVPKSLLLQAIKEVPGEIASKVDTKTKEFTGTPYIPMLPHSLRKEWQHDDAAYNFVLDFMYTLTPQKMDREITEALNTSRRIVSRMLSEKQRFELLNRVSSDSVKRRFESKTLQKCYRERTQGWKTL